MALFKPAQERPYVAILQVQGGFFLTRYDSLEDLVNNAAPTELRAIEIDTSGRNKNEEPLVNLDTGPYLLLSEPVGDNSYQKMEKYHNQEELGTAIQQQKRSINPPVERLFLRYFG